MNYESFWVGVITGVVLMILLNIRRNRRAMRRPNLDAPPAAPVGPPVLSSDVRAQVLRMKAEGQMIAAIKLVRERTSCDLKAAKDAVEMLR